MVLTDHFQLGHDDVHDDGERQPEQQDRHREQANHPRDDRVRAEMRVAHADFTRQKVWAFTPSEDFSSLTWSFTVMRHPMASLSPCATTLALAAGAVGVIVIDHGRVVSLTSCGCASRSR